jgi:hypothetical protein
VDTAPIHYFRHRQLSCLLASILPLPKSIEALEKNQAKIIKHLNTFLPKVQRDLTKIFDHQRSKLAELQMTQDTITRIRATQEPLQRRYTKRQVKPLSQTGVLSPRDANRSIAVRKAKEAAAQEKRLRKQWKEVYGEELQPTPTKESEPAIEAGRVAQENGEVCFFDS